MKKFNEIILKERYQQYGDETLEFLINTYNAVKELNNKTNDYYYCIFDLLATQVYLYFSTKNQLLGLKELTTTDAYQRAAKSPIISVLNKSHSNIMDIMQKLSLGQMEQAKLKRLNNVDDDESAEQLLKALTE